MGGASAADEEGRTAEEGSKLLAAMKFLIPEVSRSYVIRSAFLTNSATCTLKPSTIRWATLV